MLKRYCASNITHCTFNISNMHKANQMCYRLSITSWTSLKQVCSSLNSTKPLEKNISSGILADSSKPQPVTVGYFCSQFFKNGKRTETDKQIKPPRAWSFKNPMWGFQYRWDRGSVYKVYEKKKNTPQNSQQKLVHSSSLQSETSLSESETAAFASSHMKA